MFRFIHCADIHLDSPMRGLRFADEEVLSTVRNATRRALENLVACAIREQVDFVVIAGDVFDGDWEDYSTGLFFNRCMRQLDEAGIPVCLIRGNHDAMSQLTRHLTHPDNVFVFSEKQPETWCLDELQVAVHGQSFAKRDVTENLVLSYPAALPGYFNIGLLHTGLQGKEGHARYAPCQVDDLLALGYDYFALGHIHQPEVVHTHPPIVYSGNIQGRHIRESGERGCVLVTVADDRQVQMERICLDVLRWFEVTIDLTGVSSLDDALQLIRNTTEDVAQEHGDVPLCVRVHLTGLGNQQGFIYQDLDGFEHEILNVLGLSSRTIYVEQVVMEESRLSAPFADNSRHSDGIASMLHVVAENDDLITELTESLNTWHRSLQAKMKTDDAPEPLLDEDIQLELEHAVRDILVQLQNAGGRGHGIS